MPSRQTSRAAVALLAAVLALAACTGRGNWSHNDSKASLGRTADYLVTDAERILVTAGDIEDRAYQRLGLLRVRVSRSTPFHPEATEAEADIELQDEAAKLGADAVIQVKYNNRTPDFLRWASMDATGTAIKFVD